MNLLHFIELPSFQKSWAKLGLGDEELQALQIELMNNPVGEATIGLLSKKRFACSGHGKRGGGRVAYVHIQEKDVIYLILVFAKDKQANFTDEQEDMLRELAKELKKQTLSNEFMKGRQDDSK